MLATNTYSSGSYGDHSHPTLDQGKSYSRFTPPFLAFHKSSPPGPILRNALRERAWKTVKGDTTSKQMKLQTNRHLYFFFTQKNSVLSRENGFECTDQNCCSRIWMGYDKKYKGDFHSEQQNNVDHVVENFFSRASCSCGKLDHWTGSPAPLLEEWINKLCFQMNLGTLIYISFYCDLTQFILMIVSY